MTPQQTKKVTRVEVIEKGVARHFVDWDCKRVVVSLQDDGKTLKVFIREK